MLRLRVEETIGKTIYPYFYIEPTKNIILYVAITLNKQTDIEAKAKVFLR